jgi:hypothetical protein
VGPFEVVENKGPMAYQLALPDSLRCMHDVFHVSVLHHYILDPSHVIDMSSLQVSGRGFSHSRSNLHTRPSHSTTTTLIGQLGQVPVG